MIEETDIAWLSGILDGEGCITTQISHQKYLTTFLRINTTSVKMAEKINDIYRKLNVRFKQTTRLDNRKNRLPYIDTTVCNYKDVVNILKLCEPYLTTKLFEALEVINYDGDVFKLHQNLKELKKNVHVQAARL